MDGNGGHRRKAAKKTKQPQKKKNKPLKVVYISNPMKVRTSAAKFMGLVQQLTGQHAHFPDPSGFYSAADDANSSLGAEVLPAEEDHFLGGFHYDDFDDTSLFLLP